MSNVFYSEKELRDLCPLCGVLEISRRQHCEAELHRAREREVRRRATCLGIPLEVEWALRWIRRERPELLQMSKEACKDAGLIIDEV